MPIPEHKHPHPDQSERSYQGMHHLHRIDPLQLFMEDERISFTTEIAGALGLAPANEILADWFPTQDLSSQQQSATPDQTHVSAIPGEQLSGLQPSADSMGAERTPAATNLPTLEEITAHVNANQPLSQIQVTTLLNLIFDGGTDVSESALRLLGRSSDREALPEEQISRALELLADLALQGGEQGNHACRALLRIIIRYADCEVGTPQEEWHNNALRRLCQTAPSDTWLEDELRARFDLQSGQGLEALTDFGYAHPELRDAVVSLLRQILTTNSELGPPGMQGEQAELRQSVLEGLLWNGFNNTAGIRQLAQDTHQTTAELMYQLTHGADLASSTRQRLITGLINEFRQSGVVNDRAESLRHLSHFADQLPIEFTRYLAGLASTFAANPPSDRRVLTALGQLGTNVVGSPTTDQQTVGLQILNAAISFGFRPNSELQQRTMTLLSSDNSTTTSEAVRLLLHVAQTQPESADTITTSLQQYAVTNPFVQSALAASAYSQEPGPNVAHEILLYIGHQSDELSRSITNTLIWQIMSNSGARQEICADIQALAYHRPEPVIATLRDSPLGQEQSIELFVTLSRSRSALVREYAQQALLAMPRDSREQLTTVLCERYRTSGDPQLIPLMAAVALGRTDLPDSYQAALAALTGEAEQCNPAVIPVLAHIGQRNTNFGNIAAQALQRMAQLDMQQGTNIDRLRVVRNISCVLENGSNPINCPLLDAWANIVSGEFQRPVAPLEPLSNLLHDNEQSEQQLVTAINSIPRWQQNQAMFARLLARFAAGDAGDAVAHSAAELITTRDLHTPNLLHELEAIYTEHGDRNSLLSVIGQHGGSEARSFLRQALIQQLQAPANESNEQGLQRLHRAALALNGLLRTDHQRQPISSQTISSLLSTPHGCTAFQELARVCATMDDASAASVQTLGSLASRVQTDSRFANLCPELTSVIQQSLRYILQHARDEAAQHAAYDALQTGPVALRLNSQDATTYERQYLSQHPTDIQFVERLLSRPNLVSWDAPQPLLDHLFEGAGQSDRAQQSVSLLLRIAERTATEANRAQLYDRLRQLVASNDHTLAALAEDLVTQSSGFHQLPSGSAPYYRFRSPLEELAGQSDNQAERVTSAVLHAQTSHADRPQTIQAGLVQDWVRLAAANPGVGIRVLAEAAQNLNNRFALEALTELSTANSETIRGEIRIRMQALFTNLATRIEEFSQTEESRERLVSALVRSARLAQSNHGDCHQILEGLCRAHPDCVNHLTRLLGNGSSRADHLLVSEALTRYAALSGESGERTLQSLLRVYNSLPSDSAAASDRIINLMVSITESDPTGQTVRYLEESCRNSDQSTVRGALISLCHASRIHREHPDSVISPGARPANEALARLLSHAMDQPAQLPSTLRDLFQSALNGSERDQNALIQLCNEGHRQAVMHILHRLYTPQNAAGLSFALAVFADRPIEPAATLNQFRHTLDLYGQQLRSDFASTNWSNQAIMSRGRALLDVLLLTAAGSSTQSQEAAHVLIRSAPLTEIRNRISTLLDQRELSATQVRYLLNLAAYQGSGNSYTHREHSGSPAGALSNNASIYNYLACGVAGDQARIQLQPIALREPESAAARIARDHLLSPTTSEVEQALTQSGLARLAGFTLSPENEGGATPQEREQIVRALLLSTGNSQLTMAARMRAFDTVRAIVANDTEHNRELAASVSLVLEMARSGNTHARQLLCALGAGAAGSHASSQRANAALLAACRQDAALRESVLRDLIAPELCGAGSMQLLTALLTNAEQLPSMEDARRLLQNLARDGDERALSMLLSLSIRPQAQQPESAIDRQALIEAVGRAFNGSTMAAGDLPQHYEQLQDLGLGCLMQHLSANLRISPDRVNERNLATLIEIANGQAFPRDVREQAVSMMLNQRVPVLEINHLREWETAGRMRGTSFWPSSSDNISEAAFNFLTSPGPGQQERIGELARICNIPMPPERTAINNVISYLAAQHRFDLLVYLANNNRFDANGDTPRGAAMNILNTAAEGPHADAVRATLRLHAQRGNVAAATILERCETGMPQSDALDSLRTATTNITFSPADLQVVTAEEGSGPSLVSDLSHRIGPLVAGVGSDHRLEHLTAEWERLAMNGDGNTIRMLINIATGSQRSTELGQWACLQLRQAQQEGANPSAVADATLSSWQHHANPATFSLLASVAARMNDRADLREAVTAGYASLISEQGQNADADLHQRRAVAALTVLTNRELLTPEFIRSLVQNMTPELAQALPLIFHAGPQIDSREITNQFLTELRNPDNQITSENAVSWVQAWRSMAPVMTAADVLHLALLEPYLPPTSGALAQGFFSVITSSNDHDATRAALIALQQTPTWQRLNSTQQQVVREFAGQGRTHDLSALRQACDAIFGAGTHNYPLAVFLHQLGLPQGTSPEVVCSLAERIQAQTAPGAIRTLTNWAMPLLNAANLAWENSRHGLIDGQNLRGQYPEGRGQFILAVISDLANGRLDPSRQFLAVYAERYQAAGEQLASQLQQNVGPNNEMTRTVREITELPALRSVVEAYQMADSHWQNLLLDPHVEAGAAPNSELQSERDQQAWDSRVAAQENLSTALASLPSFQSQFERLQQLQQQHSQLQAQLQQRAVAEAQAQYLMLLAQGRQPEADTVILNFASNGYPLNSEMQGELTQAWDRLRQQHLATSDRPPLFNDTPQNNFRQALNSLQSLSISPDLNNLSPQARELHLTALRTTADRAVNQLFADPRVHEMNNRSQEMALRLSRLMQLFQIASDCPATRSQLGPYLRAQVHEFVNYLNEQETQDARTQLEQMVQELRTQLPPHGSIGRERLEQVIRTLESHLEIFQQGSPLRGQLNELAQALDRGALNEEADWQRGVSMLAHVAATTVAFAAASALSAATGPCAPVVFAILAPALVMVARHGTQEVLHQAGASAQGSPVGDIMFGRTFYDTHSATYQAGSINADGHLQGVDATLQDLGGEYQHEFVMNLAFVGTGRLAGAAGSARAGGSFWSALNPFRMGNAAPYSFWRTFAHECNPRAFGFGLALGAPDLAGIPHLGEMAGFALAAYHGYSGGRAHPTHTLHTATREVPLTQEQRQQVQQQLQHWNQTERNAFLDALPHISNLEYRSAVLHSAMQPSNGLMQSVQSRIADPGARAGFLLRVHEMTPRTRESVTSVLNDLHQRSPQRESDLATVFGRLNSDGAVANVLESLRSVQDANQRNALIDRLHNSPAGLVAAIAEIGNQQARTRWLELLGGPLNNTAFRTRYESTLGHLSPQIQHTLLATIGGIDSPGQLLGDIVACNQGSQFAEALAIIPELTARHAIVEQLAGLTSVQRSALMRLLGTPSDSLARASIMREIGLMNATTRRPVIEALLAVTTNVNESAHLIEALSLLSDARGPHGCSHMQIAIEALANTGIQGRPALISMLSNLPREELRIILETAARYSNRSQRNVFLEHVSRLSTQNQSRIASTLASLSNTVRETTPINSANELPRLPTQEGNPAWIGLPLMVRLSGGNQPSSVHAANLTSGEITIGRTPENDIVLTAEHVSRHHARIGSDAEGIFIENLSQQALPTRGTWVREGETWRSLRAGERVHLSSVDEIWIGGQPPHGQQLRLRLLQSENAQLQPARIGDMEVSGSDVLRTLTIDGHEYRLYLVEGWFHGIRDIHDGSPRYDGPLSPLKVHVLATSPADLARLQEVLIPALANDPLLRTLVEAWKTTDPYHATDQSSQASGVFPSGRGQGAKGFTIYLRNSADAALVQARISDILASHGLGLPQPHNAGTVEPVDAATFRVGVVRDNWPYTTTRDNRPGYRLDRELVWLISNSCTGRPSAEQLRALETELGLVQNTLTYDANGTLMLLNTTGDGAPYQGGIYATEAGAYTPRGLADRPALYRLYTHFGLNPADLVRANSAPPTTEN